MNHIVIKSQLVESLKTVYGDDLVKKCFELSTQSHPKEIYQRLQKEDPRLASCFEILFRELLG